MLLSLVLLTAVAGADAMSIEGVVENGTAGGTPVAGTEVVLRGGKDGGLIPIAQAVTDDRGHFLFANLSAEPGMVYLPGANRQGVHYPGPRLRPEAGASARVKITVYDAVAAPSPLVAERCDIEVRADGGVLEVTESLLVSNPTLTTFVGGTSPATTLKLRIPDGYDVVTFAGEFFGRRFAVADKGLTTDMPWLPGKFDLRYTYHLPVPDGQTTFERALDLPCSRVRIRVQSASADRVTCSLARAADAGDGSIVFESPPGTMAAGEQVRLTLGGLPTPWIRFGRWVALAVLVCLVLVTLFYRRIQLPEREAPAEPNGRSLGRNRARSRRGRRTVRR